MAKIAVFCCHQNYTSVLELTETMMLHGNIRQSLSNSNASCHNNACQLKPTTIFKVIEMNLKCCDNNAAGMSGCINSQSGVSISGNV